ncbi:MAG: hypothetical protein ABW204_05050 [Microbacteriaceae bacterium]|jgi:hypothetical protein
MSIAAPTSTAALQQPRTRLRLTRRGRVVFTGLAALPLLVGVVLAALNGGAASADAVPTVVTVPAGGSLWTLASEVAPDADPRDVVAGLVAANDLQTFAVRAGEQLVVPAQYAG